MTDPREEQLVRTYMAEFGEPPTDRELIDWRDRCGITVPKPHGLGAE